jgi:hypothetical protein
MKGDVLLETFCVWTFCMETVLLRRRLVCEPAYIRLSFSTIAGFSPLADYSRL